MLLFLLLLSFLFPLHICSLRKVHIPEMLLFSTSCFSKVESPQCGEFTCRWETHGSEHRHKSPQVTWHWGIRIQQWWKSDVSLFVEGGTSQIYHVHLFSFVFICLLLWLIQAAKHDDSPDRRWPMYQVPDENLDWSIARILLRCYFAHWDMKCFFMHKPNLCMFFLQTSKIWVKRKIYLFCVI